MRAVITLILFALAGCAGLEGVPSLAPRPIEKLGLATPAPAAAPARAAPSVAAGPALASQIAALLADVRAGDAKFAREDRAGARAIAAGRRAAEGSEAWIAGETARSALEAARQQSADALSGLDALLVEKTAGDGIGLAEISAAKDDAERIVARQTARLEALSR